MKEDKMKATTNGKSSGKFSSGAETVPKIQDGTGGTPSPPVNFEAVDEIEALKRDLAAANDALGATKNETSRLAGENAAMRDQITRGRKADEAATLRRIDADRKDIEAIAEARTKSVGQWASVVLAQANELIDRAAIRGEIPVARAALALRRAAQEVIDRTDGEEIMRRLSGTS